MVIMSLVFPSSSTVLCHFNPGKNYNLHSQVKPYNNSYIPFQLTNVPCCVARHIYTSFRNEPSIIRKYSATCKGLNYESFTEESTISLDFDDEEDIEDNGSPWQGAVLYKRNSSISHLEYCTTLERLGLGKLSTEISKSRASVMGLRVTKAVKDYPDATPVQISIDVTKKKKKMRLDGIIKTVITLGCNRCGKPAAECIFSEFSLLLTEEPVEEPETIDLGVIFGEDKNSSTSEDNDAIIDLEDRLHFPSEQREIDISKHIRDRVHLEITINAVCDPMCKGLCLKCGTNLNTSSCNCSNQETEEKSFGPLRNLKEQLQRQ